MIFREQTYSVLLVSASEKFNISTMELLPGAEYFPVDTVRSVGEARRILSSKEFDLVLINSPLPDENGIRLAMDISFESTACVLLFVKNDIYEEIYTTVLDSGSLVISKPTSIQMVSQTLHLLCSMREKIRLFEKNKTKVEDKIAEIRLVNRAKWLLIEYEHLSEENAHRYVEKEAMNRRLSKRIIAEEIIKHYEK